jgi:hypothetical protein
VHRRALDEHPDRNHGVEGSALGARKGGGHCCDTTGDGRGRSWGADA